ncbi:hypothetical protein [Morganella phage Mecenats66]|nr:hypothetical protein [Morganella phage Mecenats66]
MSVKIPGLLSKSFFIVLMIYVGATSGTWVMGLVDFVHGVNPYKNWHLVSLIGAACGLVVSLVIYGVILPRSNKRGQP